MFASTCGNGASRESLPLPLVIQTPKPGWRLSNGNWEHYVDRFSLTRYEHFRVHLAHSSTLILTAGLSWGLRSVARDPRLPAPGFAIICRCFPLQSAGDESNGC